MSEAPIQVRVKTSLANIKRALGDIEALKAFGRMRDISDKMHDRYYTAEVTRIGQHIPIITHEYTPAQRRRIRKRLNKILGQVSEPMVEIRPKPQGGLHV